MTDVIVELPRLRPGAPPERLEIRAAGLDVLSSRLREVVDAESRWDLRVRADSPPGTLALVLRAHFADGETVELDDAFTVVPAEPADPFPWAAAVASTVLALALAVSAVFLVRRKA